MKPLISAVLLLALAAPGAQAQDETHNVPVGMEAIPCPQRTTAFTQPVVTYSNDRRKAHVHGVFVFRGPLSPKGEMVADDVNISVLTDLGHGYVPWTNAVTDSHGVYDFTVEALAPIQGVHLDADVMMCKGGK